MGRHEPFRISRRRALVSLGRLGLLGLSGCCSLRRFPSPQITGDPNPTDDQNPFLRPTVNVNPEKPFKYCIDAHAHFLNASDIDAQGYLKGPVAHGIQPAALREFVRRMAPVVDALADLAPDASTEYRIVSDMMRILPPGPTADGKELLDAKIAEHRNKVARGLFEEMQKRNLGPLYLQLRDRQRIQLNHPSTGGKGEEESFSYEMVREAIDPALRRDYIRQLFRDPRAPLELVVPSNAPDPSGIIEFVGLMLSHRWMTLHTYQKFYSEDEDSFGIDGVFGASVDFAYWLKCPPRSPAEDQVKLQSLLSLVSGGYMLPLVGYNPWTDIKRQGASLDLVKQAVLDYGFIGVKIYPPMGYFPYGNEFIPVTTCESRPNLHELDRRLEALFACCEELGVPVMAHTSESMGRDDPSDIFGGPLGWDALLKRFSPDAPPLISAGHFGGQGSANEPDNAWPKTLATLMATPSGSRFYADLGYWTALRGCGVGDAECDHALKRIKAAQVVFNRIGDRIMYGTDWFMIAQEPDPYGYPFQLSQTLKGVLPEEKLFYKNAIECFGLRANGKNLERLRTRFAEVPGGLPSWLAEA